MTPLLFF
jgi:hypothetical protein